MTDKRGARIPTRALSIGMCLLLGGCGVVFTTGAPGHKDENNKVVYGKKELTAVTYYLPKDVLQVEAQIDSRVTTSLEYPKDAHGADIVSAAPGKGSPDEATKLESFDASIVTIADRDKPFLLDANSPGFYKNDSTINVSESGLLESINTKTSGSGGAVVQNVLKLAGTVLPFVTGTPPLKAPATRVAYDTSRGSQAWLTDLRMSDAQRSYLQGHVVNDSCVPAESPIDSPAQVRAFTEQYFGDRIELRFALPLLSDRTRLKRDFCTTFKLAELRKSELDATSRALARESRLEAVRSLTLRLRMQRSEVDRAVGAHEAARDALNAAVAEKLADEGIGTVKKSVKRKFILDLENLPDTERFRDGLTAAAPAGSTDPCNPAPSGGVRDIFTPRQRAEVEAFVPDNDARFKVAHELLVKTNSLVSLEPVQRTTDDGGNIAGLWANKQQTHCDSSTTGAKSCVFYREPVLYRLKVWLVANVPAAPNAPPATQCVQLQPPEERLLLLVGATSPVRALDLPTNAWTKRDTAISFNARGRLVSLQRNFGSAVEDSTAAVQQGVRGGVTEYETSLTSVKNIGETKNAIQLQPLEQQLAAAQKQLDVIKAQASLQAASSSSQALLDTELAGIEKNLLTAQQQLVATQTQLTTDTASAADLDSRLAEAAANAKIAQQIQDLKNQIDLLKLEKELKALREAAEVTP